MFKYIEETNVDANNKKNQDAIRDLLEQLYQNEKKEYEKLKQIDDRMKNEKDKEKRKRLIEEMKKIAVEYGNISEIIMTKLNALKDPWIE